MNREKTRELMGLYDSLDNLERLLKIVSKGERLVLCTIVSDLPYTPYKGHCSLCSGRAIKTISTLIQDIKLEIANLGGCNL